MNPTDADRKRAAAFLRSLKGMDRWDIDAATMADLIAQVRAEERERAARVAEEYFDSDRATPELRLNAAVLAAAIREGDV